MLETIKMLNELLADYQVFNMNLHGFHWNVETDLFFEMHQKYKEMYDFTEEAIDSIAERIRGFDSFPLHCFRDYLEASNVDTVVFYREPHKINQNIVETLQYLSAEQKKIMSYCLSQQDFVTFDVVQDLSEDTEKFTWMFRSFLRNPSSLTSSFVEPLEPAESLFSEASEED